MTQTYQSWFKTTLTAKLSPTDTTAYLAVAPTVTSGRLYLKSWSNEERMSFTWVSGLTVTGLTRWLSKTAEPSTAGTGGTWVAGTTVKLVAMHDQLIDKQQPLPSEIVTTTNVITATETGTTYFLANAAGFISTLPAVAQWLKFTFIVSTSPTSWSYTVRAGSLANIIYWVTINWAATAATAPTAKYAVLFAANQATKWDILTFVCDWTSWYVTALTKVAAAITYDTVI